MRTDRLTPLNELHLAKKKAREERAIAEQRLSYQLQYLEDNWGSLLTKGLTSSVKTKFSETLDNIAHGSPSSLMSMATATQRRKGAPYWMSIALSNLPVISKIAWKVAKPTVYAFAAKKFTNKLFGIKKRK